MTGVILHGATSLCPACLNTLPARIVADAEGVFMEKACPDHGPFRTIIWRGGREDYEDWTGGPHASPAAAGGAIGCPHACGLCPEHTSETCSAALMVTNRCNLHCPVCFTRGQGEAVYEPSIEDLSGMMTAYRDRWRQAFPLELCGGEPTVRDDLPEIVSRARSLGFSQIQVNSNGLRLAREPALAVRLRAAGAQVVYLGFDGADDAPYIATMGRPLLDEKMKALDSCARAGLAVVLAPVLSPGLNLDHIGRIIGLAKSWSPTIRGVHFQPMSYFGAYPSPPDNSGRLTIPDLLAALEAQTDGEVSAGDFLPPSCEHPLCSFNGLFMIDRAGRLRALTKRQEPRPNVKNPATLVREFTKRQWRPGPVPTLSIGGMLFQDAWNIDTARLKRCIIHIIAPGGGLTPLCAKYLTTMTGERLYPGLA